MKYTIERTFYNLKHTCLGWSYQNFDDELKSLIHGMRDEIGHPFTGEEYHSLKFLMNLPLYHEFSIACKKWWDKDSDMYRGIPIIPDSSLYIGDTQSPDGIVKLIYEEPEVKRDPYYHQYCVNDAKTTYDFWTATRNRNHGKFIMINPHIDHVIFDGPATIVFWKDGTKTIVKHDGKGRKDKRQAILYAFIRKIYGEGKPYHNILNEIEEAIK